MRLPAWSKTVGGGILASVTATALLSAIDFLLGKEVTDAQTLLIFALAIFALSTGLFYFLKGMVRKELRGGAQRALASGVARAGPADDTRYDLFVSSPMASLKGPEDYKRVREETNEIIQHIQKNCRFSSIYYAGQMVSGEEEFDPEAISARRDFTALGNSSYYVLLYPMPIATSALCEAGYALATGKPSVYFVRDLADLPFMLRGAQQVYADVHVHKYTDMKSILGLIDKYGDDLFPEGAE